MPVSQCQSPCTMAKVVEKVQGLAAELGLLLCAHGVASLVLKQLRKTSARANAVTQQLVCSVLSGMRTSCKPAGMHGWR